MRGRGLSILCALSVVGAFALLFSTAGTSQTIVRLYGTDANGNAVPIGVSGGSALTQAPGSITAAVGGNLNAVTTITWVGGQTFVGVNMNTISQQNGTNPQEFRIFNTYTDSTHFEMLHDYFDGAAWVIGPAKGANGGSIRNMTLGPESSGGSINIREGSSIWTFDATGNLTDVGTHILTVNGTVTAPNMKTSAPLITATGAGTPAFGTNFIGGTGGPTTTAQNGWLRMWDSVGNTMWIPVWK